MPVTVDTIDNEGTAWPPQRHIFKALGLWWLFYCDGTNMVYRTSPDGETWSAATVVRAVDDSSHFSVKHAVYGGVDYVYYAYSSGATDSPLLFCRGQLNSDGTITWGTEYTVESASSILHYYHPDLCIASDGAIFISASLSLIHI